MARWSRNNANVTPLPLKSADGGLDTGHGELTRLNYFDGLFLRASHLATEQAYFRTLARLGARAGGDGIVDGLEVAGTGTTVTIQPGLAFDPEGRPLLLSEPASLKIADLLPRAGSAPSSKRVELSPDFAECEPALEVGGGDGVGGGLYRLCVGASERLCGTEDVMGALCESACVQDAERLYRVEGVRAWLEPIEVRVATSGAVKLTTWHERSLVASAYFRQAREGDLISAAGLGSDVWCNGALAAAGDCVPLGIVSVRGGRIGFIDAWSARRERMETEPKRYWSYRLRMRPYRLFLAEVLQFQCQLVGLVEGGGMAPGDDPCGPERELLQDALRWLERAGASYAKAMSARDAARVPIEGGLTAIDELTARGKALVQGRRKGGHRILIDGGIVELPPTGYLPVDPTTAISVNDQVRRYMGEGVDLRFCRVRHDYVQHAFEEAQHMDRISLLQGLDDPTRRPEVDVLVPDGQILRQDGVTRGAAFEVVAEISRRQETATDDGRTRRAETTLATGGGARGARSADGFRFAYAGTAHMGASKQPVEEVVEAVPLVEEAPPTEPSAPASGRGVHYTAPGVYVEHAREGGVDLDIVEKRYEKLDVDSVDLARLISNVRNAQPGADEDKPKTRDARYAMAKAVLTEAVGGYVGVAAEQIPGGLWLDLEGTRDPRTLEEAEQAAYSARVILVLPSKKSLVMDMDAAASVTVTQVIRHGPISRMAASLRLHGTFRRFVPGGANESAPFDIELPIDALVDSTVGRAKISGALADGVVGFEVDVDASNPGGVRVGFNGVSRSEKVRAFIRAGAKLKRNDAALDVGQPARTVANQVIDLIDGVLPEPGFAEAARAFLFGKAAAPESELVVRAVRDWVLFHRRRRIECESMAPTPPVEVDRRYQVYHLSEKAAVRVLGRDPGGNSPDWVAFGLRRAFESGDPAILQQLRKLADVVSVASYRAGLAELTSNGPALATDLAAAGAANATLFAAIASDGARDDGPLEATRLDAYQDAVLAVTKPTPTTIDLRLEDVPTAFVAPETDGFMLVATRPVQTYERVDVYLFRGIRDYDMLSKRLQAGEISGQSIQALVQAGAASRVAVADFVAESATLVTPAHELYDAALANAPRQRLRAITVTQVKPPPARVPDQTKLVVQAVVGASPDSVEVHGLGVGLPSGAVAAVFLGISSQ